MVGSKEVYSSFVRTISNRIQKSTLVRFFFFLSNINNILKSEKDTVSTKQKNNKGGEKLNGFKGSIINWVQRSGSQSGLQSKDYQQLQEPDYQQLRGL